MVAQRKSIFEKINWILYISIMLVGLLLNAVWLRTARAAEMPFSPRQVIDGDFTGAHSVSAADIDGDGDEDIVGAAWEADQIAWWDNLSGDASSWNKQIVTINYDGASFVSAADIDGDGDVDLIGAAYWGDKVNWWENSIGDGSVWISHTITNTFNGAWAVYAADINGDGDVDVLGAAYSGDKITYWENTAGDGSVWQATNISSDFNGARSISSSDLDGDGDEDIIGAAFIADDVVWWENDGAGSGWSLHEVDTNYKGANFVNSADVDGDGDLDILGVASLVDDVTWWENDGLGGGWVEHLVDGSYDYPEAVYAIDVDEDGDLDLLTAAASDDDITWWDNSSGDGSTWVQYTVDGDFNSPQSVFPIDIDGDGDLDILAASEAGESTHEVSWWRNEIIHRSASFPSENSLDANFVGAVSVQVADIDGDGSLDILGAARYSDDITWWQNVAGDGSVWNTLSITTSLTGVRSIYPADIDGDGDVDVISAAEDDDEVSWWENTTGNGDVWDKHTVEGNLDGAWEVFAADVNGDGDLDVIAAVERAGDVIWWENSNGDGSLWVKNVVDGDFSKARSVYAGDVDGDSDLDILGAAWGGDKITWWENTAGDGLSWTEHTVDGDFAGAQSVHAADIDHDGDLDVLGAAWIDSEISWWENTAGNGITWSKHILDEDFFNAISVYASDLDGDGDQDVLGVGFFDGVIAWWDNTLGDGSSWKKRMVDIGYAGASSVNAADVDGDGDVDLLSTAETRDDINWWQNRGGQFALITTNTAPEEILAGQMAEVLKIGIVHRGRDGDSDEELTSFDLLFEEDAGDPLDNIEANAIIEDLLIYLDDGSGSFEVFSDTLVTTVQTLTLISGSQVINFSDNHPFVQVTYGITKTFFVVVRLTSDAQLQTIEQFRITHKTETSSTAEDRDFDLPLLLEYIPNISSSLVAVNSSAPIAVGDTAITQEDTPVIISVLDNDDDPDGDPIEVVSVTQPSNGTAVISNNIQIVYTPTLNFFGEDIFSYNVSDSIYTSTALVTVTVTPVNDPPVVDAGTGQLVGEGEVVEFIGVFYDPDTGDQHVISWDFDDGTIITNTITPTHSFSDDGLFSVSLTVDDGNGGVISDSVLVTVSNIAPTIDLSGNSTVGEGDIYTLSLGTVFDPGDDTPTTCTVHWGDGMDSDCLGYIGNDILHTYEDGDGSSVTITVDLSDEDGSYLNVGNLGVVLENIAPAIALTGAGSASEGSIFSLNLSAVNDPGDDAITACTIHWGDGNNDDCLTKIGSSLPHIYLDGDGSDVSISVDLSDEDGSYLVVDTLDILVLNLPPLVTAGQDQVVSEGEMVSFSGGYSDPGVLDTHTFVWDFSDGITQTNLLSPTHMFEDDGIYQVTLSVTDNDGGMNVDTVVVTVTNLAPIIDLNGSQSVDEGRLFTLTLGTVFDPGDDTVSACLMNWGDGESDNCLSSIEGNISHVYADGDGSDVTITVDLTDEDGSYPAVGTLVVSVDNISPTINLSGNVSVDEGSEFSLDLSNVADPGDDTVTTCTLYWGDGNFVDCLGSMGNNLSHTYSDGDGSFVSIQVTLEDEDGIYPIVGAFDVRVDNVPPSIELSGSGTTEEGSIYTLTLSTVIDPGEDTISGCIIHWGDGNDDGCFPSIGGTITHIFLDGDGNSADIQVDLVDDDGLYTDVDTLAVTVNNVAPFLTLEGDATVDEGGSYTVTLSAVTDPGDDTPTACTLDWGDGSPPEDCFSSIAGTMSHTYADGDSTPTIRVDLIDEDGSYEDVGILAITVNNVPPVVDAGPDQYVDEGEAVNLIATFDDPGINDTHVAIIDWDDEIETGNLNDETHIITWRHVFTETGVHVVTVTVYDDEGDRGDDSFNVVVGQWDFVIHLPVIFKSGD